MRTLPSTFSQTLVGAGVVLLGVLLATGALDISSSAGYGGVGPNFLPWVVAVGLVGCGIFIVREARTGGFRDLDPPSGSERADLLPVAWVSAGLLANAALITTAGFILSCGLCYLLAVQGLRHAARQDGMRPARIAADLAVGLAIAAPVYWTFTKLLGISLPGLTGTGWL